jgi:hypothetical protein
MRLINHFLLLKNNKKFITKHFYSNSKQLLVNIDKFQFKIKKMRILFI